MIILSLFTLCFLVDSSSAIFGSVHFVILGVPGLFFFVAFILFLIENSVSKQCRP